MINYKVVDLTTSKSDHPKASILIIYTGGTFGMAYSDEGTLSPFDFSLVVEKIPELRTLDVTFTVITFTQPIDSSNIHMHHWRAIGHIISENYHKYDGFVVLHGTDTMAYTASALSFMLKGLNKPVIFTGAQIPIGSIRSDARDNFLTAVEIASSRENGKSIVPEVCIYFNHRLLRGNRSQCQKISCCPTNSFRLLTSTLPPIRPRLDHEACGKQSPSRPRAADIDSLRSKFNH